MGEEPRALLDRLTAAMNAHDVDAMVACFAADYHSEQPLFPARTFQGSDQVRANWSTLLGAVEGFTARTVRAAAAGDTIFAEIEWAGTKADGTPLDERGVVIMGVRGERIAWGRFYVDEVAHGSAGIDAVVRRMAGAEDR